MKKKHIYIIQFAKGSEMLETMIKSLGPHYKYFETQWLVETELSATEIYNRIDFLPSMERIFICKLDINDYWGRMDNTFWEWISATKSYVKR